MRWKWIFGLLIAFLIVVPLTTYLILSRYDFNSLKPRVARAVREATGRELTLTGDVQVGLGLTPTLTIKDVSFENAPWGSRPSMAAIDRLALRVALIPLLGGAVEIKQLVLVAPDILIEKSTSGQLNLDFKDSKKEPLGQGRLPEKRDKSDRPPRLAFDQMRIEHGKLVYMDHVSQRTYQLRLREATAATRSEDTVSLATSGTYNDAPYKLDAILGGPDALMNAETVWPIDLSLDLGSTSVSAKGSVVDVFNGKGIDLVVDAEGDSVPGLLEFFGLTDVPELGPFTVSGTLTDSQGTLSAKNIELALGTESLARLTLSGRIDDIPALDGISFSATGRGDSVQAVLDLFHVSNVPKIGPFEVAGTIKTKKGKWNLSNLKLHAGTKDQVVIELAGTVLDLAGVEGTDLDVSLTGEDLARIGPLLNTQLPFEGPFRVSGHISATTDSVYDVSHLEASVQKSRLEGNVTLDLGSDIPMITSRLKAETLNLTPLINSQTNSQTNSQMSTQSNTETPDSSPKVNKTGQRREKKIFSDDPLPLTALRRFNTDVEIDAQVLQLAFLTMTDFSSRLHLVEGNLSVEPLRFVIAGGDFDGTFTLREIEAQRGPIIDAAFKLDESNLGHVFEQLGAGQFLNGTFDMDVDVTGRGNSLAQLMADLSGKSAVIMKDGKLDERLVGLIGGDLTVGLLELVNPFKKERSYTRIHCLVCGLNFDQGLAESTALLLDTDKVTVVGHGKANLKTETLDVSFKPSPKEGVGIKGLGRLNLSLGQLTKSFKLTGSLADPSVTVDPAGTFLTLGKAVGGAALLGPVGLAAALAGGQLGDKDPCTAAIEAIEKRHTP